MNFWETYEKLCLSYGKKPSPVGKEFFILFFERRNLYEN